MRKLRGNKDSVYFVHASSHSQNCAIVVEGAHHVFINRLGEGMETPPQSAHFKNERDGTSVMCLVQYLAHTRTVSYFSRFFNKRELLSLTLYHPRYTRRFRALKEKPETLSNPSRSLQRQGKEGLDRTAGNCARRQTRLLGTRGKSWPTRGSHSR